MFRSDFHPSFIDKPPTDAKVWRYMDLARYLSLLQTEALHFARADQMSDRWEGSYSEVNQLLRPQMYGPLFEEISTAMIGQRWRMLQTTHMNCWHLAEIESAAMWEIYQREGRGVAVRSTWGDLTSSITAERAVFGAKVKYVDYKTTFIPEDITFEAFMHKRESFSHEKEVRLIMITGLTMPHPTEENSAISLGPEAPVLPVSVDLTRLMQEVFVAPNAPDWIADTVADVTSRYGFNFPVRQSDLARDPIE